MTSEEDGIALYSGAHPRPKWGKRLWFWLCSLFGYPSISKDSLETLEVEINHDPQT